MPSQQQWLDTFAKGARELAMPFELQLQVNGNTTSIVTDKIFRLLPCKRVVLRGVLNGNAVVIKLFRKSASSARHLQRERAGHERVSAAGVACPPLIGDCITPCGNYEGLIYALIDDADELGKRWGDFDTAQKQFWLQQILQIMRQLHEYGAWQDDIHAGNFLLKEQTLYLLDLGSVVVRAAPLSPANSINNLGQLIAQFDISDQPLFETLLDQHCIERGWNNAAALREQIAVATRKSWQHRISEYLAKAQRDCSLTIYTQSFSKIFACRRAWMGDDLARFEQDPDAFMATCDMLKAGNSATVVKARIGGKAVVIKRYNIKNVGHAVRRSLQATRAEHCWRYSHLLEIAGMASLKPVAWLERRCGPLRSTAYFICEWIEAQDLLTTGNQRALNDDELQALRTLLQSMQLCRLSHGDFKANNLLLTRQLRAQPCIALIDLDAMRRHSDGGSFQRAFAKDLARLQRNWDKGLSARAQIDALLSDAAALKPPWPGVL